VHSMVELSSSKNASFEQCACLQQCNTSEDLASRNFRRMATHRQTQVIKKCGLPNLFPGASNPRWSKEGKEKEEEGERPLFNMCLPLGVSFIS
jgi:hypothetical protein